MYQAIGDKLGLTVKEVCYLTNSEIRTSLQNGASLVAKQLIQKRFSEYLIFSGPHTNEFSDDSSQAEQVRTQIKSVEQKHSQVRGITAVAGTIRGVVRVVKTIKVLADFQAGEVLVASMTAPEYVPAMKKAAAIITDEGGITCHAAVISRELGTPCIVGTKFATKFFNDGDLVEVDGKNGIVKKI